ncbi:MAG: M48 family metalloprotease [bacterium]
MKTMMFRSAGSLTRMWAALILIIMPLTLLAETDDQKEIRIGKEAVQQVEKEIKLVKDPVLIARLEKVGKPLAQIACNTQIHALWGNSRLSKFEYTFKVVDDKSVNAFSLPGGTIYVHTGLLNFVESDDELAGVLAHEIAHASHHHFMELTKKQSRLSLETLLPILLVLIAVKAPTEDTVNILQGTQLYQTAQLNNYGQDAEKDADSTGMIYMIKAGMNPVGMYTFLDRLRKEDMLKPNINWGIFRTHPPTEERSANMIKALNDANIPINPSEVSSSIRVDARPVPDTQPPIYEVVFDNVSLFRPATEQVIGLSETRAKAIASKLNKYFDSGPEIFEVKASSNGKQILILNQVLTEVTTADTVLAGVSQEQLLSNALTAFRDAVRKYRLKRAA